MEPPPQQNRGRVRGQISTLRRHATGMQIHGFDYKRLLRDPPGGRNRWRIFIHEKVRVPYRQERSIPDEVATDLHSPKIRWSQREEGGGGRRRWLRRWRGVAAATRVRVGSAARGGRRLDGIGSFLFKCFFF